MRACHLLRFPPILRAGGSSTASSRVSDAMHVGRFSSTTGGIRAPSELVEEVGTGVSVDGCVVAVVVGRTLAEDGAEDGAEDVTARILCLIDEDPL